MIKFLNRIITCQDWDAIIPYISLSMLILSVTILLISYRMKSKSWWTCGLLGLFISFNAMVFWYIIDLFAKHIPLTSFFMLGICIAFAFIAGFAEKALLAYLIKRRGT